jgi:nucleoside-diphosphate-sugar epimerase
LKAIVVTGSINAVTTGQDVGERVYDSNAWLPLAIKDAIEVQNPYISYCVSKAEAEKAIWKYVEDEKPAYSVSVLLPALIFGPPIQPIKSVKKMNYSTDRLYELFNGTFEVVPPTSFPSYVSTLISNYHLISIESEWS